MNPFRKLFSAPLRPASHDYGLVGWLEQTRVQLPLKGVECQFHVCEDLVSVELDQIFHQDASAPFDCVYQFPLPARAAVHRCELHVNGRIIRARVESQIEAENIVRRQKAAGHRTALVQAERDNLFTLSLGNLQPGDVIVVRFAYVETLSRLGDWSTLRIPFCPGVRYIPGTPLLRQLRGTGTADDTDQVPDASRISPPRIDALHRDAAYMSIEGRIENPTGLVADLSSSSHSVAFRSGEAQVRVQLAGNDDVPDRDFALRWTEGLPATLKATAWGYQSGPGGLMHALVALAAPNSRPSAEATPQDYYFLVDQSSSMEGMKWEKAILAFRSFLNAVQRHDRVWLTLFNNTHRDFAEKPLTLVEWLENEDANRLASLGTGGGTELLPALGHVLNAQRRHSARRVASVILITDGEVGNEEAILNRAAAFPNVRIHTFGIDTAVNDALLRSLAERHRGTCCLLQPTDDIPGAVTRVTDRLRQPALMSIQAGADWEPAVDAASDLHSSERLTIALRAKPDASNPLSATGKKFIALHARRPNGTVEVLHVPLTPLPEPALSLIWARQRIAARLEAKDDSHALALAKEYNLLCRGAAFVAWDEAERVPIANESVVQPCLEILASRGPALDYEWVQPLYRMDVDQPTRLAEARGSTSDADAPWNPDQVLATLLSTHPTPGEPHNTLWSTTYFGYLWSVLVHQRPDCTLVEDPAFRTLCREWIAHHDSRPSEQIDSLRLLLHQLGFPPTEGDDDVTRLLRWTDQHVAPSHPLRPRFLHLAEMHAPLCTFNPAQHP